MNSTLHRTTLVALAAALVASPVFAQTTSQTTPQAPAQTSPQAPAQTSSQAPAQTSPQAPAQTSPQTPAQTSSQAPAQTSPQTPAQTSPQTSASAPAAASQPTPAAGASQAATQAKQPKVKDGSLNDVNSIGTRDPGKRGIGNWYSTESEIKVGKQYASELEKSAKLINDPVVTEYVNRIGQNLVKNSDAKVPFTIKVLDSDEINAMALPGGFFYVNSGLILAADEEAELAGVMAHEIAHVAAHHQMREQTRMNYAQLGMLPVMIMVGGWAGYGIYEAAQIGIPLTFLHFSRTFEAQADYLGLQYMYKAGYDPQAFLTFFEKIQALNKQKPGALARAFETHPPTPDRIETAQKEIATILPAKQEYVVTTSEFDDVKARLARIENKRKIDDAKDGKKPTLRRASAGDTPSTTGDDRPTLHPRSN
jgi:predicted Zn-dependent protease